MRSMPRAGWLCGKAGYAQQCLECKDKLALSVQFKVVQCLFHLASNKILSSLDAETKGVAPPGPLARAVAGKHKDTNPTD